ncbi:hypothetical protein [Croceibacterium soli]|uniref:hypothetical protein n=1 Tax=Croceibacterium soli TaxID=1739690 RepID=UPI0019281C8E|nr:hypothetical protein [Croceibacterium soli]
MIAGVRGNWQTIIADLALILFMVTAAAMGSKRPEPAGNPLPAEGEPLAIYRPHRQAPPLGDWLAAQAPDERQQVTIIGRYRDGDARIAADAALKLASEAETRGVRPRIVIEPAESSDLLAVLAFDIPADWHGDCNAAGTNGAPRPPGKDKTCD